jgi:sugar O-acyltransferase (sialic acid O-acetyltransferase NeuD family)
MDAVPVTIPAQALIDPEEAGRYWISSLAIREGQEVEAGQILARLEPQGAGRRSAPIVELRAAQAGYVVGLHVHPGQTASSGDVLCYIGGKPSLAQSLPAGSPFPLERPDLDPTALLVYGGGGHGKAVIEIVRAMRTHRLVGVIDDQLPSGSDVIGATVLGGSDHLKEWYDRGIRLAVNAVGGIGKVDVRVRVFNMLAESGFSFPAVVHPSAVIEPSAVLEPGVQVLAQAYVGSAARVGFGSVLNAGSIVSHDCVLGRVTNLSPGAALAGNVRVEDHAQIGMNATVNMHVTIGAGCIVGNGATVKSDVPPGTRVWAGSTWPVRKG